MESNAIKSENAAKYPDVFSEILDNLQKTAFCSRLQKRKVVKWKKALKYNALSKAKELNSISLPRR